jgi:exopolysaccharide/PEP-CTERM locus tyrosine autokinase
MSKIQEALKRLQDSGTSVVQEFGGGGKIGSRLAGLALDPSNEEDPENANARGATVHVDQASLRAARLIAPDYHDRMLADEYRDIKRPLIANALGRRRLRVERGNLIIVTSAIAGEGKTFTSLNLALSIAQEQDLSVLLVDADVAKSHISTIFDVADLPGLLDFLDSGSKQLESLLLPTDLDGLAILPAGGKRENATELLSGSRMEWLVHHLSFADQDRIVIFDTPPLLQTSEAKAIAHMAGQIVLVVKAESTSQAAVVEALHLLDGEDKAVNLVLNQARDIGAGRSYEYGYGYRYGESLKQDGPG